MSPACVLQRCYHFFCVATVSKKAATGPAKGCNRCSQKLRRRRPRDGDGAGTGTGDVGTVGVFCCDQRQFLLELALIFAGTAATTATTGWRRCCNRAARMLEPLVVFAVTGGNFLLELALIFAGTAVVFAVTGGEICWKRQFFLLEPAFGGDGMLEAITHGELPPATQKKSCNQRCFMRQLAKSEDALPRRATPPMLQPTDGRCFDGDSEDGDGLCFDGEARGATTRGAARDDERGSARWLSSRRGGYVREEEDGIGGINGAGGSNLTDARRPAKISAGRPVPITGHIYMLQN